MAALPAALVILLAACSATSTPSSDTTSLVETSATTNTPNVDGNSTTTAAAQSYAGTSPAPEFPGGLDWLNTDVPLTLAELRGKVVLLDFWTYGCINCIHIIPDLRRLEEEFAEELVVIGVHSAKFVNEGATDNIRQVILRYDLEHPVVNDRDFEVWRTWGAQAWPTTVLIDPAGNVVGGHAGEGVYDVVQPVIASLVDEFAASGGLDRSAVTFALEKDGQPERVLAFPGKVAVAAGDPRLFIADTGHNRIVVADRSTGDVLAVYGSGREGFEDGPAQTAAFASPQGLALDGDGLTLYVADTNNHAIRAVDTGTGQVRTLLGTGRQGWPPAGGTAPEVDLASPWDVLVEDTTLYIAMAGHHQIWSMDLSSGTAGPLVGSAREGVLNGALHQAELAQPSGLALADGLLYFADSESSSIRYADVAAPVGETGLVAGGAANLFEFGDVDGAGEEARFQHPLGVAVWDGSLIVADTYNSRLRLIDPITQQVTTFLGGEQGWQDGEAPRFYEPGGLAVDGDTMYVADTNNHVVRIVDLPSGSTTTLVLKGIEAFTPPPEDADYRGTIVTIPPIEIGPGSAAIVIDVTLPTGYEINDEAPSSATFAVVGDAIALPDEGAVDLTGVTFPRRIPIDVSAGSAGLTADLTLVYCRADATALCFIEQVRFDVAVSAVATGGSEIVLGHDVVLPDLDG